MLSNIKFRFTLFVPLISLLVLLSGCHNKNSELDELYQEVVSVHDEVMPKTYYIRELKKKLSLVEENNILDSVEQNALKRTLLDLKIAEDAMWDWMHSFDDNYNTLNSDEEKTNYLLREKESMLLVEKITLSSIKDAEQFLNKWQ